MKSDARSGSPLNRSLQDLWALDTPREVLHPEGSAARWPPRTMGWALSLTCAGLALGCEAELVPSFVDEPRLERLLETSAPVFAVVLERTGVILTFGGGPNGPPLAGRLASGEVTPLPLPQGATSLRSARSSGDGQIWVAGPGFLASGAPERLNALTLPQSGLPLVDVASSLRGGAFAVGPSAVLRADEDGSTAPVNLSESATAALAAVWVSPENAVWIAGANLVARIDQSAELDRPNDLPPNRSWRSIDGADALVYVAGASDDRGALVEIAGDRATPLPLDALPPLHVVRARDRFVWMAGDDGFLARFDGQNLRAFAVDTRGAPIRALAIETPQTVYIGGGTSFGGFVSRFSLSSLPET